MAKRKWYEWMLTVVYIAMVLLCVYLNLSPDHKESLASIIVNVIMFLIVGIVFLCADFGCFAPMNSIIKDLKDATDKIKQDVMNTHSYLWEPYQSSNVKLFRNGRLQELFRDFLFELNRESDAENLYYRPNIDDYINDELVDKVMHRNELNQVAGLLTGLGILGTFIGLSLGLQHFNTGTTAEMTESIEPLMAGIKVAFHTSIFGMVFSLVFNAIYKKKLYDAEETVDEFVNAFKKYVLPDTQNDGMNQMVILQKEQVTAINEMYSRMSMELSKIIEPQFKQLNSLVADFEATTARNEADAVSKIVDEFVSQMNKSLDHTFDEIHQSVEDQYKAQKNNAELMEEVLKATGSNNSNLNDINNEIARLITTLNHYSESIQAIQNELQNTIEALRTQNEKGNDFIEKERETLDAQEKVITGFKDVVKDLSRNTEVSNDRVAAALTELSEGVDSIRQYLEAQQTKNTSRR